MPVVHVKSKPSVGDRIRLGAHRERGSGRRGTVLEVLGEPGHEHYRVSWENGRETILYDSPDVVVLPGTPA